MLEFFCGGEKVFLVNLKFIFFFVIFIDKVLVIGFVCIFRYIDKVYKILKNLGCLKKLSK